MTMREQDRRGYRPEALSADLQKQKKNINIKIRNTVRDSAVQSHCCKESVVAVADAYKIISS